jgi:hypothetical protein
MTERTFNDSIPAVQRLAALSDGARLKGLVRAAHFVTIGARDTYEIGTSGLRKPERLRAANELLHKLLGIAVALAQGQATYPDDVIVEMIEELAPAAGIDPRQIFAQLFLPDVN